MTLSKMRFRPVACIACTAVLLAARAEYRFEDPRNFFGVWSGPVQERVTYARTMGYSHILYSDGMYGAKGASGLWFVLESPEYATYQCNIDDSKTYPPEKIAELEEMCAMKDASAPFPHNLATGWFHGTMETRIRGGTNGVSYSSHAIQPNFQKKAVIDKIVSRVVNRIRQIEKRNPDFKFGGFCWDVPNPSGDFYGFPKDEGASTPAWKRGRPGQVTLAHWTGRDCVSLRPGDTVDYPTYSEGCLRYRMALRRAAALINPKVALIVDPWDIGKNWVKPFFDGGFTDEEFRDARAEFVMSEGAEGFLDQMCFTNGFLKADQIAYACDEMPYDYENDIRNLGLAASRGAWSVWFGCPCPGVTSIRDVPPRMKLAHEVPRMENLNNTPLSKRRWDAENGIYDSPTAHLDKDVVWVVHPYTKRVYFCCTSPSAVIRLPKGFKAGRVTALTSLLEDYRLSWFRLKDVFRVSQSGELRIAQGSEFVVGEAFVVSQRDVK